MNELIAIAFTAFFIENVLLTQFLGICSFIGVGKKRSSSLGMGLAVLVVVVLSSIVTWTLHKYVLDTELLDLTYMKTIVFILVIAALVQIMEILIKRFSPSLYKALGIYLPLITTNCAVLGVALINVNNGYNFSEMLVYSTFIGLGYLFVMYIFAIIREKIELSPVPKAFKGIPIAMIVAAILAILFSRFGGII